MVAELRLGLLVVELEDWWQAGDTLEVCLKVEAVRVVEIKGGEEGPEQVEVAGHPDSLVPTYPDQTWR